MKISLPPLLCGVLTLVAAALGPMFAKAITYHVSRNANVQWIGSEPINILAAILLIVYAFYPHSRLRLFAFGAAAFLLYQMATIALGQQYTQLPGNAGWYFLLFVGISIGAIHTGVGIVAELLRDGSLVRPTNTLRWSVFAVGILFGLMWLSMLAANAKQLQPDYFDAPQLFWMIKYLDLALIVPTSIICALAWSPSHKVGVLAVAAFSVWMLLGISGMQVAVIVLDHGPSSGWVVFGVMTAIAGWLTWLTYQASQPNLPGVTS